MARIWRIALVVVCLLVPSSVLAQEPGTFELYGIVKIKSNPSYMLTEGDRAMLTRLSDGHVFQRVMGPGLPPNEFVFEGLTPGKYELKVNPWNGLTDGRMELTLSQPPPGKAFEQDIVVEDPADYFPYYFWGGMGVLLILSFIIWPDFYIDVATILWEEYKEKRARRA